MNSKIIIAKPCHEKWNNMTPEEQGRHCAVCSKVVKDFTKMKKEEIVHSLKNTDGEVCGRINVKQLTPATQKQKVYFWINGVLFRKAIYPIMALLGVTFLTKKATAQITHDYPVKGKMDVRDYHVSSKKVTVVVKSNANTPIESAEIRILSGVKNHPETLITDVNGKVAVLIDPKDLVGDVVEIEIAAVGFEYKQVKIKIVKDIQTIEIKMDEEMHIMGEMMYIPEKTPETPKVVVPEVTKTVVRDSMPIIDVCKCDFDHIKKLPLIRDHVVALESIEPVIMEESVDTAVSSSDPTTTSDAVTTSTFDIFPVPSFDHVNIVSNSAESFNMDVFDGNGKKIHAVVKVSSRYTLDVSTYAAGVYYILITVEGKAIETKKIVVSR